MVLPRKVRQLIEKQDFDAVETAWFEKSEDEPLDIGFFGSVARALVGAGQADMAKMLLELLDEDLETGEQWDTRLELLRRTGPIGHGPKLHAAILETIRRIHDDKVALEQLIETVRLDRGGNDVDKTWDKVGRLESLIRFDKGVIVYMSDKGVGTVVEVNHKLESFKVDIQGKGDVRVGFRAAGKMLQALSEDHVLARKVRNPGSLDELSPSELLSETLQGFDRPLTASEIRSALVGLVPVQKWNSWWTSARKHPQIVASAEVRNGYQWVESSEDARGAIWKRFESAAPRGKLDLLRRSSAHDERLRERMTNSLERLGRDSVKTDPGLAFEIWNALDKVGAASADAEWRPQALLTATTDPLRLFASLEGRSSKDEAYRLIREHRDDWVDVYQRALLAENDAKLIGILVDAVHAEDPELRRKSVDRCMAQPARAPGFFVWIVESAAEDEALRDRLGIRLFKKTLAGLGTEELSPYRARLLAQCDSGGALPRLLPHLASGDAQEAEQSVVRAMGLALDQRKRLQNAVQMKFPELVTSEELPLYALEDSIRAKRTELKTLLEDDIPTNRRAIEEARALGDLRENFEYKSARQRHEYLTARASELDQELSRSRPLVLEEIDPSEVRVGTEVLLEGEGGEPLRIAILGPWESSPEDDIVSYESDLAKALLGKKPGDEIGLQERTLAISSISRVSI